jgi:predicted secreted protein
MDNRWLPVYISCCLACVVSLYVVDVFAKDKEGDQKVEEPITMTDDGQPIQVSQSSPTFTVRLPANASTGYRWMVLEPTSSIYTSIKQAYMPLSKDGGDDGKEAAGYEQWTFTVSPKAFHYPRITQLHFVNGKPWRLSPHDLTEQQQTVFTAVLLPTK